MSKPRLTGIVTHYCVQTCGCSFRTRTAFRKHQAICSYRKLDPGSIRFRFIQIGRQKPRAPRPKAKVSVRGRSASTVSDSWLRGADGPQRRPLQNPPQWHDVITVRPQRQRPRLTRSLNGNRDPHPRRTQLSRGPPALCLQNLAVRTYWLAQAFLSDSE